MASQDTGQILKYFAVIMAFLLTHECVGQTTDFPKTSMDFQFHSSGREAQVHYISEETLEYIVVVELNASQAIFIEQIKSAFAFNLFPLQLDDSTEITAADITTVCNFNDSGYKCVCEDQYVWPCEKCTEYGSCDDITNNTCRCINDIPTDRQFCQPVNEITNNTACAQPTVTPVLIEYLTEIQIDAENTSIIDELMNYWMFFDFPYTISDGINITEINITTVCSLNETQYRCKCEGLFVWPNDTCHSYEACDDIIDGSCTCINALPIDGQFCQFKEVTPVLIEYLTEIQIDAENTSIIDQLMNYWMLFDFPYTISDGINITEINITTVCSLNETQYRCKCEGLFVWPNDTCHSYEACDDIIDGSCTCINALPINGQFCQLKEVTPVLIEYLTEIQIDAENTSIIDQLMNYWMFFDFPYTISDGINITEINITTVCSLNETQYRCKCEGLFVWPNDTCHSYEACDDIIDGSCTCINALPIDGQFCQLKEVPTVTSTPSTPPVLSPSTLSPTSTPQLSSTSTLLPTLASMPPSTPLSTSTTPSSTTLSSMPPTSTPLLTSPTTPSSTTLSSTPPTSTPLSTLTPLLTSPTSTTPSSTTLSSTLASMPPTSTPLSTSTTPSSTTTLSSTSPTSTTQSTTLSSTLASMPPTSTPSPTSTTSSPISTTPSSTSTTPSSTTLSSTFASMPPTSTPLSTSTTPSLTTLSSMPPTSTPLLTSPTSTTPSTNLSSTLASMPPTSTPLSTSLTSTTLSSTSATSTTPSSTSTTQSSTPLSTSPTSTTPLSTTLSSTLASIPPTSTTPLSTSTTLSSTLASMPSSSTQLPPPSPKTTVIGMSITLNKNFNSSLTNINSEDYKYLSGKIKATIELSYSKNLPAINYISGSTKVHGFRRGSVIADYTIKATSKNLDFSAANTDVSDSLKAQGIILTNADFAQSDYDCINEEIGFGKINDVREGICGNGMKGTKEYKCESDSSNWKSPVDDNCVLDAIYDIKSNITSLIQEDIPGFMANFSSVVEQNDIQMIQAPATIKAIVYILNIVAVLSQNISINKPEMVNFIKAVDTIVSGNVGGKWNELNKGNTSTILLSAIEKISERLIDDFAFNGISIQLNRTTIKNSFSITSTLPNSTTEIVIPQVPNVTTITIIIFTTLDNVLPTHTRNNHDTNNSDVRINGDVVVVKVNETLPKINFVFDTTNVSLGNPQCVFWNFSLDAWDSSGCEVKPSGNKEGVITCECNHTTSFSILMSPFSLDDKTLDLALALITYIGVGISMASLILCLIIEIIVWKSMTRTMTHDPTYTSYMRHVSIVNIAVSLLIANICFIIGAAVEEQEQAIPVARCSPAVFFMHFFYLALFFWMLISALLLFYRTVMVFSRMSRSRMMAIAFIVGYGAPLLIAVITVASTAGPEEYIPKKFACWLNWKDSMALLAFVIPALTIVAINLVVLIVVLYKMLRRGVGNTTQPGEKHALVVIARCVAILTPIFGLTWAFGIGTMVSRDFGIHVVFVLLNSLQGLFILVFGTLLDKKVRELLLRKLSLQKLSSSHTNSTSAGSSSTPRLNFLPWIRRRKVYNVSEANTSSAADRSNSSYVILNT